MVTIKCNRDFEPLFYEQQCWVESKILCGIDEVGRGCLAGPVVAAAVILKPYVQHKYLRDSKELTQIQRGEVYNWLLDNSSFAVGIINHRIIDRVNIHYATIYAMKRAFYQLISFNRVPDLIVVDHVALRLDNLDVLVRHFSGGERLSSSIAAASIIAKVTRDNLMLRFDNIFSGYNFSSNKGYGTKAHKDAINDSGLIICHRNKFVSKLII